MGTPICLLTYRIAFPIIPTGAPRIGISIAARGEVVLFIAGVGILTGVLIE